MILSRDRYHVTISYKGGEFVLIIYAKDAYTAAKLAKEKAFKRLTSIFSNTMPEVRPKCINSLKVKGVWKE